MCIRIDERPATAFKTQSHVDAKVRGPDAKPGHRFGPGSMDVVGKGVEAKAPNVREDRT